MGVTEVTQEQYHKGMTTNQSHLARTGRGVYEVKGTDTSSFPMLMVSWDDAMEFCRKLSAKEGETYRLPTEAEWEYACRAGTASLFSFGDKEDKLTDYAWFGFNSDYRTHRVRTKEPNPWGLYDMHGNVWEWVEDDWYDNYEGAPTDGSAWIDEPRGADRVIRGGSWYYDARYCRSANRFRNSPVLRLDGVGFRLARSVALSA